MRAVLVALAIVMIGGAWAQGLAQPELSIPIVDVEANCSRNASGSIGYIKLCVREEQMAYDSLRFYWKNFDDNDKRELLRQIGSSKTLRRDSPGFYRGANGYADYVALMRRTREEAKRPIQPFRY